MTLLNVHGNEQLQLAASASYVSGPVHESRRREAGVFAVSLVLLYVSGGDLASFLRPTQYGGRFSMDHGKDEFQNSIV